MEWLSSYFQRLRLSDESHVAYGLIHHWRQYVISLAAFFKHLLISITQSALEKIRLGNITIEQSKN